MHASIWRFAGDADDLLGRYDALMSEVGAGSMLLHVCLRAADGILMIDAAPNREAFAALVASDGFRALRERHGLPEPERIEDFPVHVAYAGGRTLHSDGPPAIRADAPE